MPVLGQVIKKRVRILDNVFAIRTSQGIFTLICCRYLDTFINVPPHRELIKAD